MILFCKSRKQPPSKSVLAVRGDMFKLCKVNGREKHRVWLMVPLDWMIQGKAMVLTIGFSLLFLCKKALQI